MTRSSWERTGGLPGLSLTLQDTGVPNLTLHGPDGLVRLFSRIIVVMMNIFDVNSGRHFSCNETLRYSE